MERQRKTIPDKNAFSKYLLPKIRYLHGFSVNFNKFQNGCQIKQNYAEKKLQNAVSVGFCGFCKKTHGFCMIVWRQTKAKLEAT